MKHQILVYGIPKGETERYTEVLLSTQLETHEAIEALKQRAALDGFHSFRVTKFDGSAPDFAKTVNL